MYTAIHLGSNLTSGLFSNQSLSSCNTVDQKPKLQDKNIIRTMPCQNNTTDNGSANGRSLATQHRAQRSKCSLWWLLYSKIGYYTLTLPYKFVLEENGGGDIHYRLHTRKVQYIMYCFMVASGMMFVWWRILIVGTCTSGFDNTFQFIDQFSDLSKLICLVYIWRSRKCLILRVMNQRLPDLGEDFSVGRDHPRAGFLDSNTVLAWSTLSFYTAYVLFTKIVGDVYPSHAALTASYASLRTILASDCGSRFCFGVTDVWVIATAGFYCKMAYGMRRKLQHIVSSPASAFHPESVFTFIRQFQDQIADVNLVVQEALLVCLVTDLPYYVLRAIPSVLYAESFTFVMFRRILYVVSFFGSFLMTGIMLEKLQGTIRLWISKASPQGDLNINAYQSLLWDLDSNRDLGLSLGGFAYINIKLFVSMLSITLTYTIIYYQFHSTGTVAQV